MDPNSQKVWICSACGVEQGRLSEPPEACAICVDERQYVPASGQEWITLEELSRGHRLDFHEVEADLWGIRVSPRFGIGQQALLVRTRNGNVLWDVPPLIDAEGIERVRELGGIAAIVASHPHMYGAQLEWSAAFGDAPVYVAAKDAGWVMRGGDAITTWDSPFDVVDGVTLLQLGGHFPGSAVALWPGADGRGVLLTGDTIGPVADPGWVTFLRSYPNSIPLSAAVVRRVAERVDGFVFDRLYGSFGIGISADARGAVKRSAKRYIEWVSGEHDAET